MENNSLISAAVRALRPRVVGGRIFGDVGAAILSQNGRLFLGVSVDTPSWGLCAERSALAAMITTGEYRFKKAVAVWLHPETGELHILPPCGICREFMRSIDPTNLDAEIILQTSRTASLRHLLPEHEWPEPIQQLSQSEFLALMDHPFRSPLDD